jgi:hypothetical protein
MLQKSCACTKEGRKRRSGKTFYQREARKVKRDTERERESEGERERVTEREREGERERERCLL